MRRLDTKVRRKVEKENAGRSIDFLGYEFTRNNQRLRKTIKKKFAAGMGRVKSRRRRKEIEDSYRGWCKYGRCRHLWNKLTGKDMGFADKGIATTRGTLKDGKKFFDVRKVPITDLINREITVLDFESNIETSDLRDHGKKNNDRYVVLVKIADSGETVKFVTSAYSLKDVLDQCREKENSGQKIFPVEGVEIQRKDVGGGKTSYKFHDK